MATGKTERELLEEMNERLKEIAGLLAIQGKTRDDQIDVLTALGFDSRTMDRSSAYPVKQFASAEPEVTSDKPGRCAWSQDSAVVADPMF